VRSSRASLVSLEETVTTSSGTSGLSPKYD
jgi:hypothetical protein